MDVVLIVAGLVLVLLAWAQWVGQAQTRDRARDLAIIGRELQADGWVPRTTYPCGCVPAALCVRHAMIRAELHYRAPGAQQ